MTLITEVGDAEICHWFASVFAWELSVANIDAYRAGAARPFLDALEGSAGSKLAARDLNAAVDAWEAGGSVVQRRLASDFAMLFVMPGPDHASPYASSYSADGAMMGTPHDAMVSRLQAKGLVVQPDVREPADHVSVMLDFLAHLHSEDPAGPAAQEFARAELRPWVGSFVAKVHKSQLADPFYAAVAALLLGYLDTLA